jgi:hypothetical protein
MASRAEVRKFADELRLEMDRLGADRVYVPFTWIGPYQQNPYDTPLPFSDTPRVFRALYEAVDYLKHDRYARGIPRTKIVTFERKDLPTGRKVTPIPSTVIWRSTDPERDAAPRRSSRSQAATRGAPRPGRRSRPRAKRRYLRTR